MNKTIGYLKEVRAEMSHVNWPTRSQAIYSTLAVVIVSVFVAYFLGLFDKLFSLGLDKILSL